MLILRAVGLTLSLVAVVGGVAVLARAKNPCETEVADRSADSHSKTEVDVKSHEDQHQAKTEPHLDEMQQRLQPMPWIQYSIPPVITAHDINSLIGRCLSTCDCTALHSSEIGFREQLRQSQTNPDEILHLHGRFCRNFGRHHQI